MDMATHPNKPRLAFCGSSKEDTNIASYFWKTLHMTPVMESRLVSSDIRQRLIKSDKESPSVVDQQKSTTDKVKDSTAPGFNTGRKPDNYEDFLKYFKERRRVCREKFHENKKNRLKLQEKAGQKGIRKKIKIKERSSDELILETSVDEIKEYQTMIKEFESGILMRNRNFIQSYCLPVPKNLPLEKYPEVTSKNIEFLQKTFDEIQRKGRLCEDTHHITAVLPPSVLKDLTAQEFCEALWVYDEIKNEYRYKRWATLTDLNTYFIQKQGSQSMTDSQWTQFTESLESLTHDSTSPDEQGSPKQRRSTEIKRETSKSKDSLPSIDIQGSLEIQESPELRGSPELRVSPEMSASEEILVSTETSGAGEMLTPRETQASLQIRKLSEIQELIEAEESEDEQ
ncbi:hypothetical protein Ahia01_001024300 [Argonauta hians]